MRYFGKLFSWSEQLFFEQDAWDLLQLGAADGLNDRSGPMEDGGGWVGDFGGYLMGPCRRELHIKNGQAWLSSCSHFCWEFLCWKDSIFLRIREVS